MSGTFAPSQVILVFPNRNVRARRAQNMAILHRFLSSTQNNWGRLRRIVNFAM